MGTFQWFPGHMARALRQILVYGRKAQIVFHILDSRAPLSSFHPGILTGKNLVLVMTKTDLANPAQNGMWRNWFQKKGYSVLFSKGQGILSQLKQHSFWREAAPSAKAIVVGLPNVGKSTFINNLAGKKKAKTGSLPGITRGPQWIKIEKIYLLDTPGIFYPKNLPDEKAWRLAAIGVIPQENYAAQIHAIAERLWSYSREHYDLFRDFQDNFFSFLSGFARERGLLLKGGDSNLDLAASQLILDFQKGKWGRITLETPN